MKTFKEFLNESSNTELLTEEQLKTLLETEYSEAYQKYLDGVVLYKGFKEKQKALVFKPSHSKRKSAYTYNYYTYIVDNSPDYSNLPKRANSVICTTSYETARYFGDVYVVLPKNGSSIAVCHQRDFWFSFESLATIDLDLETFNVALNEMFNTYKLTLKDDSYESFINSLTSLDKYITSQGITTASKKLRGASKRLLEALLNNGYKGFDIIDYLEELLDPKDIKSTSITNFKTKGDFEVYTSSDCIVVSASQL